MRKLAVRWKLREIEVISPEEISEEEAYRLLMDYKRREHAINN